jgi:outer membrane protein assembly factor BamD
MIKKYSFYFVSLLLVISSCKSNYDKALKSGSVEVREELAWKYFENKKYFKASPLFKSLLNDYSNSPKLEKIFFHYVLSDFYVKDYYNTAYEFKKLAQRFPRGEYTERAYYYATLSYYNLSPNFYLDQEYTKRTLEDFQLFLDRYPKSEFAIDVNIKIDELQRKLEKKAFNHANLYYKTGYYNSAVIAFQSYIDAYPDAKNRDFVKLLQVEAAYKYADNSIEYKKIERFENTLKYANNFIAQIDKNPSGDRPKFRNQLLELKTKSENNISKLRYSVPQYYFKRKNYSMAVDEWRKLLKVVPSNEVEEVEDKILNALYLKAFSSDVKFKIENYTAFVNEFGKINSAILETKFQNQISLAQKELSSLIFKVPVELNEQGRYAESRDFAKAYLDSTMKLNQNVLDIWRKSTLDLSNIVSVDASESLLIELIEDARINGSNKYAEKASLKLKDYPLILVSKPYKDKDFKKVIEQGEKLMKSQRGGEYRQEIVYLLIKSSYKLAKRGKRYERLPKFERTLYLINQYGSEVSSGKYASEILSIKESVSKQLSKFGK